MSKFDRREVLKFLSLVSLSYGLPHFLGEAKKQPQANQSNVLIVVFDAFSAHHLQVHGYGRQTMPNLTRLMERGTIYHNHYANGNFTTPGTASLLTGALPWTHRAMEIHGLVAPEWQDRQIFNLFEQHHRIAYSHNPLVDTLLRQFENGLDTYIPFQDLLLENYWIAELLGDDFDMASIAIKRIAEDDNPVSNSLYLSDIYQQLITRSREQLDEQHRDRFLHGLPSVAGIPYDLETGINWMNEKMGALPQPFLGYFHFFPPHQPYRPPQEFYGNFYEDGFSPPSKPEHPYFSMGISNRDSLKGRRLYDEFILYLDAEFKRLYDHLEQSGLLDNTWLIFTSDHGELFERGIIRHSTPTLYDPVIRVPLVIFAPGQQERVDIYQPTSSIDILPTLLSLNDYPIPAWLEGDLLPPFREGRLSEARNVFSINGRESSSKYGELTQLSVSMVKGDYKLTRYIGYDQLDGETHYELYDIQQDPQELVDLMMVEPDTANALIAELEAVVAEVNEPYMN